MRKTIIYALGIALIGLSHNLSATSCNPLNSDEKRGSQAPVQLEPVPYRFCLNGSEPIFTDSYKVRGLSVPEGSHTWSDGDMVEMAIPLNHEKGRVKGLKFLNLAALHSVQPIQEIKILVNEQSIVTCSFGAGNMHDVYVPFGQVKDDVAMLKMLMPNACLPGNGDPRRLAFRFSIVELLCENAKAPVINLAQVSAALGINEAFLRIWMDDAHTLKRDGDPRPITAIMKGVMDQSGFVGQWEALSSTHQQFILQKIADLNRPAAAQPVQQVFELPDMPERVARPVIQHTDGPFYSYNVSAMGNNCGLNCLDIPRAQAKQVLKKFKDQLGQRKLGHIRTPGMERGQGDIDLDKELQNFTKPDAQVDAPIEAALLCYLAHEMVFNLRVYFGQPDIGYIERDTDPENLPNPIQGRHLFNPKWPTLNIINLGAGHYNILTRAQGDELLRKYARVKEDLQQKGDVDAQKLFELNGPAFEAENARIIKEQFLNKGNGGWVEAYMNSLKP